MLSWKRASVIEIRKEESLKQERATRKTFLLVACAAALCTSCAVVGGRQVTPSAPVELPYGYVTSEYEQYAALLMGRNGQFNLRGGTDKVEVPVGEYRLAACIFEAKDGTGERWRIAGQGNSTTPVLQVNPGGTTALTFGPPLTASLTVRRQGSSFDLGLDIRGQASEIYPVNEFRQGGGQAAPPQFVVRDESGEIVARGRFKYG